MVSLIWLHNWWLADYLAGGANATSAAYGS